MFAIRPLGARLLVAFSALVLVIVVSSSAAAAPRPHGPSPALAPARASADGLLATCTGQASPYAGIGYGLGGQVDSAIIISCAPPGSTVSRVSGTIALRHACGHDLNVRLDKLPRSAFLQSHDCSTQGGPSTITFASSAYNGIDPNGPWTLYLTDWCDNGCEGAINTWSLTVEYLAPTPVPPTPTVPTPTRTNTPRPTWTPIPTPTARPGCDHLRPDFQFQAVCPLSSFAVQFTDTSTSGQDPIQSWDWDFGDGGQDHNRNPEHSFHVMGDEATFTVTLTVRTASGCEGSVRKSVLTYAQHPEFSFELISPTSGPIYFGDVLTFRATIRNGGRDPYPETDASVYWKPAGYSFVSASPAGFVLAPSGGPFDPSVRIRWHTHDVLAVGAERSHTLKLRAKDAPPDPPGSISHPHRVEAWLWAIYNPALSWCNDRSIPEADPEVLPRPSPLTMTKSLVDPPAGVVDVGDVVTFEIRVTNETDADVTVAALDDTFDPGVLAYVDASPPPDAQRYVSRDQILTWEDQLVPAGRTCVYTVQLRALQSRELVENCASYVVYLPGESDPSSSTTSTAQACARVEVRPTQERGFSAYKRFLLPDTSAGERYVRVGESIQYTLGCAVTGDALPFEMYLMDQLSPVSAIDNPAWTSPPDVIGDAVWWDFRLPDPQLGLPVTKSSTIVFAPYKTFGPAYPLRNVATWTARWDDGTEETRTVSDWVYVVEPGTDPRGLAVVKTLVSPASGAVVRDTLEYEISVTNVTGEIMSAVAVTDTYPSSCMTLQRADPAPSSVASGVVVWDGIGPLGPGDTWRAEMMFHADAPCSQALNCVEARAPGPRATYLVGADCAPTDIGGGAPSLRVSKRRTSPSPVAVGDPVDWQITVTNVGGAPASWVVLRDRCKPDGLAFLTASPAPDAVDPQTGQLDWNDLGSLAPGASHTVDVSMQAVGAGPGWQNCADVTYLANGGIEVRSDCDIVDVVAQGPAIRVTKVRVWPLASAAVAVSDTVAFSLTVRNVGSVPLSMVDLLDTFDPARLEYLRPPMAGSHQPAPGSVLWDLDPLQPGASASRLASFRVLSAGGSAINCARASGEGATGPRVEDTACVGLWTEEPEPGVTVRKSALGLADLPQTGDVLHFQIIVQNTGNTSLLHVPLEERFVAECLAFVTASPLPDGVDPLGGHLSWLDLGPLAPGEAHTVDVMLRAAQSCWPLENCASTAALDIGLRQLTATDCALVWVGEGPAVPLYLPLVFKEWTSSTAPPVPTPTSSPTATGSPAATATATASPTASATPPSGATVVVPPGSTLILDQDFSGGTLDGWTPTSGIWEVGRGYMAGELFEGLCWNMRSEVAGDLLYQGRVCACSGAHDVGLVFRASADGSAGYEASVDVVDGVFRLVKRSPYEVLASYPTEAGWLGTWYDVAVLADGPHIEAYLDGVKRLDVTDGSYASGHLGVVVDRAVGHFDDLRAWSLP